eukprot:COSAG06_NODE_784_length_12328_cov_4.921416_14_plen_78_part_00
MFVPSLSTAVRACACVRRRFLWQDERGNWHLLMHNMGEKGVVAQHAFSRDGAGGGGGTNRLLLTSHYYSNEYKAIIH